MRKILRMWEDHSEILVQTFPSLPSLDHLNPDDRDTLELLDFYMEDCLEAFIANKGHLDPRFVVLLYDCKCDLARLLKKLDGVADGYGYFEQLLELSNEVLRHLNVKEARLHLERQATHDCEPDSSPSTEADSQITQDRLPGLALEKG